MGKIRTRIGAILACVFMVVILFFCACGEEQQHLQLQSLTLCIDEAYFGDYEPWIQLFLQQNKEVKLELNKIPASYNLQTGEMTPARAQRRAQAIERMRVEIMAGKGADVYIIDQYGAQEDSEALFTDLSKTMRSGVFADLRPLMEQSQTFSADDFLPQVLAAGQADGGQYLLPMGYSVSGLLVTDDLLRDTGMDAPQVQQNPASFFGRCPERWAYRASPLVLLREPVLNYRDNTLGLKSDALRALLQAQADIEIQAPYFFDRNTVQTNFTQLRLVSSGDALEAALYWGKSGEETVRFLPVPDETGGVSGVVCSVAAIGANSKQKETAFALLTLLTSEQAQCGTTQDGRRMWPNATCINGLPVRRGMIPAFFENYVEQTRERQNFPPPTARCVESFAALETRLNHVYLCQSESLQNDFDTALEPYFAGEASLDAALDTLAVRWQYYLEE